jgi:cell division protein FtsI/penicillin-binding protein 2
MDTEKTVKLDFRRLTFLGLCLTFGLAIVVAQLLRYQVLQHTKLDGMVSNQRVRKLVLSPPRGYISDANGHILAMNTSMWDLSISPNLVTDPEYLGSVLMTALALDQGRLQEILGSEKPWIHLAHDIPYELGEAINALQIDGLICEPISTRIYPMADLVSHVLGIVNEAGYGFYGVEGYFDQMLRGIAGSMLIEIDSLGDRIPRPPEELNPPEPGADLVLTLDINIQSIAIEGLRNALADYKAESGTVIVMDPKTGALLAVASLPGFDPNDFATVDGSLLQDPSVSRMWEPGSIFKIITWGAGLDSGTITPEMMVFDKGRMEVGGSWSSKGCTSRISTPMGRGWRSMATVMST